MSRARTTPPATTLLVDERHGSAFPGASYAVPLVDQQGQRSAGGDAPTSTAERLRSDDLTASRLSTPADDSGGNHAPVAPGSGLTAVRGVRPAASLSKVGA